jgi:hypothetical protein
MKYNRVISTAVMFLLLGITLPAFAQKGEEDKGGGGGKAQQSQQHQSQPQHAQPAQRQAQPQHTQQAQRQAQPQHAQQTQHQAQPQRTQQAQRQAQPSKGHETQAVANNRGNGGGHYGRISDVSYRSHFGQGHSFHMGHPRVIDGYNRFQYGGYWFGYNQGWPVGWDYNDDCYVEYIDGAYYMFDVRHPGFRLTLSIF